MIGELLAMSFNANNRPVAFLFTLYTFPNTPFADYVIFVHFFQSFLDKMGAINTCINFSQAILQVIGQLSTTGGLVNR